MGRPHKLLSGIKLGFYIPLEWHDQLMEIAKEKNIPLSDLCRIILKEYLDNYEKQKRGIKKK
ncbi:ORF56 family plasmid copy control protein [Acidianus ambivalens]|uniref:Ribbon-helix-helix domain-containing protein n=1 Tax=Acidianus ambivalens TaxID=2283 RepID=A0A6G1T6K6_ACIAM|nr:ORF56 family plasmid copy control protein [Acidianus ambivalens]MQL56611.1 hypothetical protein [Acidianus ambivalens]